MGEGEILEVEQTRSLAAPFVFFIVFAFQFATKRLQDLKRGASKTYKEMQLRGEIKQLLKEAASYSQPSTFAQAAKLRRMAAAKEKELANYQAHLTQEVKQSYDLYLKVLFIAKVYLCVTKLSRSLYMLVGLIGTLRDYELLVQVVIHIVLVLWFWSSPVAFVSQHLVQPFGRLLSWKIWGFSGNYVRVGIIPWLVLCSRVSKFACRLV